MCRHFIVTYKLWLARQHQLGWCQFFTSVLFQTSLGTRYTGSAFVGCWHLNQTLHNPSTKMVNRYWASLQACLIGFCCGSWFLKLFDFEGLLYLAQQHFTNCRYTYSCVSERSEGYIDVVRDEMICGWQGCSKLLAKQMLGNESLHWR